MLKQLGSQVDLIYRHSEFLRSFDSSIRQGIAESYTQMGMNLISNAQVQKILKTGDGESKKLELHCLSTENQMTSIHSDYNEVIYAVGRHGK